MLLKSQPANPVQADGGSGQDETYYTDLLKMKLNNTVWVQLFLDASSRHSYVHISTWFWFFDAFTS